MAGEAEASSSAAAAKTAQPTPATAMPPTADTKTAVAAADPKASAKPEKKSVEPEKTEVKKEVVPVKSSAPIREDNLLYDLRHMAACDITPLPQDEAGFLAHTRDGVQFLVNQLFDLPRARLEEGQSVKLPLLSTTFQLPREKPVPKEKPKTRWEKFMEKRGMVKKKKSRLVYDEITEDWKPRYGFRSAKKEQAKGKFGIYEFKKGEDSYSDPFERMRAQKKLDEMKHKMREVRNKVEAQGGSMKAAVPSLGPARNSKSVSSGRGTDALREVLRRAQESSGSRMKFDKVAKNEPTNVKKRKSMLPESMSGDKERERYMKFAGKVLSGQQFDKEKMAKLGKAKIKSTKSKDKQKGVKGTPGKGRRSKNPGRTGGKHGKKIVKK